MIYVVYHDDDSADDDIDAVPVTPRSVGSDRVRGAPRFAPTHAFFLLFVLIINIIFLLFIFIIIIIILLFTIQIYIFNVDFAPTHAFLLLFVSILNLLLLFMFHTLFPHCEFCTNTYFLPAFISTRES